MRKLIVFVLLITLFVSCKKNEDGPAGSFLTGNGVFVVNEGNFMGGNGSLSFFSNDSSKIYNDLFKNVNGRPLGDVPNSMEIQGNLGYIVVNNSGKIEVIDISTLESVKSITGLVSPRNIGFTGSGKAYVTSIYSDSLSIIDAGTNTISGYINLRRSSESIIVSGSRAFVANWVGGNEVMVINTANDEVIDSIEVGIEPESMAIDRNNMLWVLCNGGWTRENFAELDGINTMTLAVDKRIVFPSKEQSPACLKTDGSGEFLYYLESGVRKMSIDDAVVPSDPLIPESGHYFYKLGVDPATNDIFVTDAVDYQQRGYLLSFDQTGALSSSQLAGIIPGSVCFKTTGK